MITILLTIALILSVILNLILMRKVDDFKKLHDYYIEVDEENERLRKKLGEK